jgi:hypothetical protein
VFSALFTVAAKHLLFVGRGPDAAQLQKIEKITDSRPKAKSKPFVLGPTMMLDPILSDAAQAELVENLQLPNVEGIKVEVNSAPFKGVKLGSPPAVDENVWDGSRLPNRLSHVTIVPFHEFKGLSEAQKTLLAEQEIEVEIDTTQVFWLRGSPTNAASGCKGLFYANLVLTPATIESIKAAREKVGLPAVPPAPPQAVNNLDKDPRLAEFKFHKSITSIMPKFVDEIDAFKNLEVAEVQGKIIAMERRLAAWALQLRIVANGDGNRLELTGL